MTQSMTMGEASDLASRLKVAIERDVFGQSSLIDETLCCLLSSGHILMTGAPGLAKTTLVRVFAEQLGLQFGRIQFTPDLLPSDIVGSEILNMDPTNGKRTFEFSRGPVFTNLLLADEINRASPRTQSALLEAMQERTVTVGGKQHTLARPFMVFATQNPFESEGTFPLPEAQLDRFLVHTLVPYPDKDAEDQILAKHAENQLVGERESGIGQADKLDAAKVQGMIAATQQIRCDEVVRQGIRDLVRSSRPDDELCPDQIKPAIWYGAGPRAGISLVSLARALALLEKKESVRWEHVRRMAKPALRHRLRLTAQGSRDGMTEDTLVEQLLERLESRQKNLAKGIA